MNIKKITKSMIPKSIKDQIKKQVGVSRENITYEIAETDRKKLVGRTVIVTGGSGAIGSAVCFRLAMEGAIVGVAARSIDKANIVVNNIKKNGGNAIPVIMDVTDKKSVSDSMEIFVEQYRTIDILINNAGGSARQASDSFKHQEFGIIESVLKLNLLGTMYCTHEALKFMPESNKSRIINMSSVVGLRGKTGMTDYASSKAGVIGFTKSLALELGQTGITVNSVSPGSICQIVFDKNVEVKHENVNCKGQGGNTDDVANVVAFIASDESKYITGHNFVVDGGRTLGLWGDN